GGDDGNLVNATLAICLKNKWNVENDERMSLRFRLCKKFRAPLGEERVNDLFKPLDLRFISHDDLAEAGPVDGAVHHGLGKGGPDQLDPGAAFGIELVDLRIRVIDGNAEFSEHFADRRFSHSD